MNQFEVYTMKHRSDEHARVEVRIELERSVGAIERYRIEDAERSFLNAVDRIMRESEGHTDESLP